jgi:hypothetical protein
VRTSQGRAASGDSAYMDTTPDTTAATEPAKPTTAETIARIRTKWQHLSYNPLWKDDGFDLLEIAEDLVIENQALREAVVANDTAGRMDLVFRCLTAEAIVADMKANAEASAAQ